jgi:hypothetical protein
MKMIKTIDTLIPDMLEVIEGKGGWDATITEFFSTGLAQLAEDRFSKPQEPRTHIGLSSVGNPCKRELWYIVNTPGQQKKLSAEALGGFFYGDMIELLVISLAKAAGHRVDGLQQPLEVFGIPGTGDCIIDGMVVDVKSASQFGFEKFKQHKLREDDPFGYISQLSSYLYGYKDDPRVTTKNKAAFLAINKNRFKLVLDVYDLTEELANKEQEVQAVKDAISQKEPPPRLLPVPEGKSGNMALGTKCSYCGWKNRCWDNLRGFAYSSGPKWLTHVAVEPRVPEIKGADFPTE